MSNIFNKNDIKAGYLLLVKDNKSGDVFNMTVVPGSECETVSRREGELCCCNPDKKRWWPLSHFNAALETPAQTFLVVAVYGRTAPAFLLDNSTDNRERLWERKPDAKKMTVAEIAKKLGYPVEIVEG